MSVEPVEVARDYVGEMRVLIDAEMLPGVSAPSAAVTIVEKLRANDPDLLAGWLDVGAVGFVREAIGAVTRSTRSHLRQVGARSAFADAAEAGDVSGWLAVPYVVDDRYSRKPLGDLVKAELLYVAKEYDADARAARLEAAFFRALAKHVGAGP